jgi:hypothetical protein
MHKLMDYVCDELEKLENKIDRDGKLSMAETEYLDTLAHTKKNLLKAEEMYEDDEYSSRERSYNDGMGGSYARGRRGGTNQYGSYKRDSRGRYSREGGMVEDLRELMQEAPDDRTRQEFQKLIHKLENM